MTALEVRAKFDPTDYLMDLTKKKYLEVAYRVQWINHDAEAPRYDSFEILTEKVDFFEYEDPKTKKFVREAVFKATVILYFEGKVVKRTTAHGSESNIDFPAFWEKAETKAIGRALAEAGFGTQFAVADFDEGTKPSPVDGKMGPALSDSPVKPVAPKPAAAAAAPRPAPAPSTAPAKSREEAIEWLRTHSAVPAVAQILNSAVTKAGVARVSELPDVSIQEAYQAALPSVQN